MIRILISGGGGFVGNPLCRHLLQRQYKVRCVDNFHKGNCDALLGIINHPNFEFVPGDITDASSCKNFVKDCDVVIHLAAIVGFPACKRQPLLSAGVNVTGTRNLLDAMSQNQKMIFASTGSVYGAVQDICTEDSMMNPQSEYGFQKKIAEDMVTQHKNSVSFRFATGFGLSPCMRVNLLANDFCYQAVTNRCLTIFEADFKRTFIHVNDMARAFEFGIEPLGHKVYNCGDDNLNWTKRQLAEYIKSKTECFVTYGDIGKDLDQRNYAVSHKRINDEGFKCKTTMEQGIDELLKAMPLLKIRHQYE